MKAAGIIAEYNPFHSGHRWQMQELRRRLGEDTPVVCVMSGNWVQRGDAAILEKHDRAATAVRGGADLVLELPLTWASASAERFARGGVELLAATGVVDTLVFGSESENLPALEQAASYLRSADYQTALKAALKTGCSFAAARQRALDAAPGLTSWNTRTRPNDQLALEYLKALEGTGLRPLALPRRGAAHDGPEQDGVASASALRARLLAGEDISALLPGCTIRETELASLRLNERGVLAALRTRKAADFLRLPDCSEGLEHRMERAAQQGHSIDEVCRLAKTKRYAYARLRRLVVWSYLGLTGEDFAPAPPYLRVLATNERGRALLHEMKKNASLPILPRPAAVRRLGPEALRHMELEARATDLWQLCRREPGPGGTEWTQGVRLLAAEGA
ncbi:MAG: nucleotidyltransferase family protein [Oscillospiraceae bacterium]|nr:nucleotidyltransferase family protein [Oscillospiraceae bacterium]